MPAELRPDYICMVASPTAELCSNELRTRVRPSSKSWTQRSQHAPAFRAEVQCFQRWAQIPEKCLHAEAQGMTIYRHLVSEEQWLDLDLVIYLSLVSREWRTGYNNSYYYYHSSIPY